MPQGLEPGTLMWAVGWDVLLGDMPEEADPSGLATRAAEAIEARAPQNSYVARTAYAMAAAFALPYAAWLGTKWLLGAAGLVHQAIYREAATALLKGAISIRGGVAALREATEPDTTDSTPETEDSEVERLIREAGMPETLATADPQLRRSRALRTLGNDFRDGVVGPLLYYSVLGIPGAVAYRVVKTLSGRWRRLGEDPLAQAARRLDSAATVGPAVASSLLLSAGAQLTAQRGAEAWDASRKEARERGANIETGWTEAAMAGGLGVRMSADEATTEWPKDTNPDGRDIDDDDMDHARQLFWVSTGWAIAATLAVVALRSAISRRRR